jgi:hypothetical protein
MRVSFQQRVWLLGELALGIVVLALLTMDKPDYHHLTYMCESPPVSPTVFLYLIPAVSGHERKL